MPMSFALLVSSAYLCLHVCASSFALPPENSPTINLDSLQSRFNALLRYSDVDVVNPHRVRKPDCFRRAAAHIRTRCDHLEVDELARVRAAISMTMCELKTAQHRSLPMECSSFNFDTEGISTDGDDHSSCVEALSRSTQFWASYSGYLREIPQLCLAFQKGNDVDRAQQLYRNNTQEMVTFLRYLSGRAEAEEENRLRWRNLVEEAQEVLADLRITPSLANDLVHQMSRQAQDALNKIFRDFFVRADESRRMSQHELDTALSTHSRSLSMAIDAMEQSIASRLDLMYAGAEQRMQDISSFTAIIQDNLVVVNNGLSSLDQSVHRVADSANRTSSSLEQTAKNANGLYRAHTDVSRTTAQLAEAMSHLATMAQEEIIKINDTATAVRTVLQPTLRIEQRFLGLVSALDPGSYASPSNWILTLVWTFLKLMWWMWRTVLSSPSQMLVCILAFFIRRAYRRLSSSLRSKGQWTVGSSRTGNDVRYYYLPSTRLHSTNFPWARPTRAWRIPHSSTDSSWN